MSDHEIMAGFVRHAEESYAAMYEAHVHNVKDLFEEAQLGFSRGKPVWMKLPRD